MHEGCIKYKKFWEELTAYFLLIQHRPYVNDASNNEPLPITVLDGEVENLCP
jgi:hypothetical protein